MGAGANNPGVLFAGGGIGLGVLFVVVANGFDFDAGGITGCGVLFSGAGPKPDDCDGGGITGRGVLFSGAGPKPDDCDGGGTFARGASRAAHSAVVLASPARSAAAPRPGA